MTAFTAGLLPIGLAWSPDGRLLASATTLASANGYVTTRTSVREVASGAELATADASDGAAFAEVSFAPDGSELAVLDANGVLARYRLPGGTPVAAGIPTQRGGDGVAYEPDGQAILTSGDEITVWGAGSASSIGRSIPAPAPAAPVVSTDGRFVAIDQGDAVQVYDSGPLQPVGPPLPRPNLPDPAMLTRPLAFAPGGDEIAVAGGRGAVQRYAVGTGASLGPPISDPDVPVVSGLAYSPDGRRLAIGAGGRAVVVDRLTGERIGSVIDLGGTARANTVVDFTADGLVVATSWVARQAHVADPATGRDVARLDRPFISTAMAPAAGRLVLGASDGTVQSVALPGLDLVGGPIHGDAAGPPVLALAPDGRHAAVSNGRGLVRLVDLETGTIGTTQFPAAPGASIAFGPDGRSLVLPRREGGVTIWWVDVAEWRRRACELAGRNLTAQEWARYLPNGGPRRPTCDAWPLA
jgi:WD40 repeat protein